MRGTGCVGSQSLITNDLGDETVVGVRTHTDILVSGVVDDIQVDVIKSTDADEFTFSTAVFDFSLGGQGVLEFNLTIFLCRYGEEYNLSVQFFFYICMSQSQGCTDDRPAGHDVRSSELPESPDWHIYVPGCGAHPVPR